MTPEQEQEITRLRSRNLSPKQIARQLSLRPAEVTAFIQVQAQGTQLTRELSPLYHCLIDEGWYWFRRMGKSAENPMISGF